jgi:polysaccharide biosynthesis protein PslH
VNILILSHRVPFPPNKGEKIRTYHQLKYLSELGHDIHLFAPYESADELAHFDSLHASLCRTTNAAKLSFKLGRLLWGLLKGQALSVANFYTKTLQHQFDALISQTKVDAILCSASSMAEYVFNSSVLANLPTQPLLIMDFMDVDSDKWGQYAQQAGFPMSLVYAREQRYLANYERRIVEKFDACYLIADAEVQLFNREVVKSNKVQVMGNGLDRNAFYALRVKPSNAAPIFLFTGVMDYKPNEDAVIWFVQQCWPTIIQRHPKAKFVIAGMNPSADIKRLAHQTSIEVTGFVDDILPYYHQADIFVAPFRLARGVQNKVLQAFSCGLPVVTTPMGAEGINCRNEHDVLLATTPADFIQQIQRLLDEPSLAIAIGGNAEQLILEQYSWQGQIQPLVELLKARGLA